MRNFATNEYAVYVSDSWRVKPGLTITAGIRYENNTPAMGNQRSADGAHVPLQNFWASAAGRSRRRHPVVLVQRPTNTYDLIGPANGKPSWFGAREQ